MNKQLGFVVGGSLLDGLTLRIQYDHDPEQLAQGKFVVVEGDRNRYFCLITNIKLETSNPDVILFPPSVHEQLLLKTIKKNYLYTTVTAKPMLMLDMQQRLMPVKTLPTHFCVVREASEDDVALVFGREDEKQFFSIGRPPDMLTPVCIDLDKFTERSNGVFGKTGTGKTFLTRVLLAGIIKQKSAVNLVFDMHSEYGLQARQERKSSAFVKGLKTLFPDRVSIFSLDPASTRRRGSNPDVAVTIPYSSVYIEDILALQTELNLHNTALEAAYLIAAKYKKDWLSTLLASGETLKEFAAAVGAHPESVAALYRKLKRIEKFGFFTHDDACDAVKQMLDYIARGTSVVLEFGNYSSSLCYLLVANIITRNIHEAYVAKTEKFLGSQRAEDEPQKLLITIEEAHKFLNPLAAQQTIFGTIAREMRKYYVSLLTVDQRPSGIDSEILSQLGTRLVAQLNDEKDIASVLAGTADGVGLRAIIASLDSKQQALVFGHAVPMPVVIHSRSYDEQFYQAVSTTSECYQAREQLIDEIFS